MENLDDLQWRVVELKHFISFWEMRRDAYGLVLEKRPSDMAQVILMQNNYAMCASKIKDAKSKLKILLRCINDIVVANWADEIEDGLF